MGNNPSLYQLAYDWAYYTDQSLGKRLQKLKIGKTFALDRSRTFNVVGDGQNVEKIVFSFLYYGKFVDMGVGKGQTIGDVRGNNQLLTALGIKGRKAKKWYSKTIYPQINDLSNVLVEYYGTAAQHEIIENIDNVIK